MNNFDDEKWYHYGEILQDFVCLSNDYDILTHQLNIIPFRRVIKMDINRISDAIRLRVVLCAQNEIVFEYPDNEICDGSCSVLELLASLAFRIDQEYTSDCSEDHPEILFSHFMKNLGLDIFTDQNFHSGIVDKYELHKILTRWMDGNISRNGAGGLFPLIYHPNVDQRGKELWDQMFPYIAENFFGRRD